MELSTSAPVINHYWGSAANYLHLRCAPDYRAAGTDKRRVQHASDHSEH